jgi:hypothetical protein
MSPRIRQVMVAAALLVVAIAVLLSSRTSSDRGGEVAAGPAKVFGRTAPASPAEVVDGGVEIRRVARQWATAWVPAGTCGDARALERVLELSTGGLRRALERQPPRQTAGVRCQRRGRVVSVLVVDGGNGRRRAIVERPGEAGGDSHLELEITMTAAGPRASGLDY